MRIKEKRSDKALMTLSKRELIGIIRVQEHNLDAYDETVENQYQASLKVSEENDRLKEEIRRINNG